MARLPRVAIDGILYYVTSYGDHGKVLFKDATDYQAYLELLKRYKTQYDFKLFSYLLAPDHIALCVELKKGITISAIMHNLHSMYTKYYNKRYGKKGHLFQSRFKSNLIEKEPYLLALTRYIHLVPLRKKLVTCLTDYPYSSYLQFLGKMVGDEGPHLESEVEEVLSHYQKGAGRELYEEYIRAAGEREMKRMEKELKHLIIGSDTFVNEIKSKLEKAREASKEDIPTKKLTFKMASITGVATLTLLVVGFNLFYQKTAHLEEEFKVVLANKEVQFEKKLEAERSKVPFSLVDLNNSEWVIDVTSQSEEIAKQPQKDRLYFSEDKMHSSYFLTKGFSSSNYTVTIQEDGSAVWETIQSIPDGGYVSWHGQFKEGQMRGVVSEHTLSDETPKVFSFEGTQDKQNGKLIQWREI